MILTLVNFIDNFTRNLNTSIMFMSSAHVTFDHSSKVQDLSSKTYLNSRVTCHYFVLQCIYICDIGVQCLVWVGADVQEDCQKNAMQYGHVSSTG